MKIVVTGASGYIGSHFLKFSQSKGHEIVALSRNQPKNFMGEWIYYDLQSTESVKLPQTFDAVIHLATTGGGHEGYQDIKAAEKIIESLKKNNGKFIFVSSQTARANAPTEYGKTKWDIEQKVLLSGGWVVRPGQVYGGELRGLFGKLAIIIKKLPILPAFLPAPNIQPIHVDDLSEALIRIAERSDLSSNVYCIACIKKITFTKFLSEIASSRLYCRRLFIPIPISIINIFLLFISKSLRIRMGFESLRSLFSLPLMETSSDLKKLGLELRSLQSGMHRSGSNRRRLLFLEGQTILSYILKTPPKSSLLRRYVRAIEKLRLESAIHLPTIFVRYPKLLTLVDKKDYLNSEWHKELIWRISAAITLAEATPQGALRFLGLGYKQNFLINLRIITHTILSEIFWKLLSILMLPLLCRTLPQSIGEISD
jgi:nucleoside-diphosphate-sugar epimerase